MTEEFDEAALRHWLVDYLVTNIGCSPDEIDFDAPLNDLAVGSSDAVVLTGELSELLGRTVSPVEFWQYPTINALSQFLTGGEPEPVAEVVGESVSASDEPIAVVGLGCRFPGDIRGPEAYWDFLAQNRSAVTEVPADRWAWFDDGSPEGAAALAGTTRWGSFLSDVDAFDNDFFEISPSEAAKMDPQQRLLLEVTHEALEHAGIPAPSLRHTQTGVFAGACVSEYGVLATTEMNQIDAWTGTGNALSIIANRVSYFFDLRGPSVTVDTACSSSLVAVHLACQSLRSGESNLALAAGVNLLLSPAITRSFDQLEAMSPTGRCHAFDASADGFVRGEGAGVVVLKRLSDAVRDGDRVLALVRGSAVNQDGRSNGLMAPNPAAQMAVLRAAYANAGVEPRDVEYVEAHGTGTLLGDPIEARALGTVLGRGRPAETPLLVGAVKSNLGHLEAAAGVAGFAKAVLALQQGKIPANLGYEKPNPHIPFDKLRLKVVAEHADWPQTSGPRRAGVSSFGFGGTNAHIVLEQAPSPVPPDAGSSDAEAPAVTTLVVSGRSDERIASTASMLAEWMSGPGADVGLPEVAHTLNHHRTRHARFATVCARSREDALAGLTALAAGQSAPGVVVPAEGTPAMPGAVFVYSGQGSQWPGMAQRLLADEPAFAAAVAELEPDFVAQVGFSLQEVIAQGRPVSGDAQVQPVLMGLQLALTQLWRSYGVHPDAVIGHSMGEITAAVVAGALTAAEGLRVISIRSKVMSQLAGQGAVALVELDPESAATLVAEHPTVEVAGYVSPRQTVVAGAPDAVDAVIAAVTAQSRFARRVNMEVASHTALMDPVLPQLRAELADLTARTPTLPFYSTVAEGETAPVLDAEYWAANVRQPVRFSQAITAAGADHGTFIEISPHPLLTYAVADTLAGGSHRVIETLSRDTDDTVTFHTNLNRTHIVAPADADHAPEPAVTLPATPWHHRSYWVNARRRVAGAGSAPRSGTLLGDHTAVATTPPAHLWQARLVPERKPYPGFHRFDGVEIVPLSVLLSTLAGAAAECGATRVEDVKFDFPVVVDQPRAIQVFADTGSVTVSSSTAGAGQWLRHAAARLSYHQDAAGPAGDTGDTEAPMSEVDTSALPELYRSWGVEGLGFSWTVQDCRSTTNRLRARIAVAEPGAVALLDAAIGVARLVDPSDPRLMVPAAAESVGFDATADDTDAVIDITRREGADGLVVDILVTGAGPRPIAEIRGLRYTDLEGSAVGTRGADRYTIAHALDWQPWAPAEGAADGAHAGAHIEAGPDAPGVTGSTDTTDTTDTTESAGTLAVTGTGAAADELRERLAAAGFTEAGPDEARYVLYVADSDSARPDSDQPEDDLECAARLTSEVAALVGRLAERDARQPATLWVVTRGVRDAASEAALRQSCLWGLAAVIGAEQPQLWGGLIDLEDGGKDAGGSAVDDAGGSAVDDAVARALAGVLTRPAKAILSMRDGRFFESALVPVSGTPVAEPVRCRPDAAYLVTGGMGALGLLMADWLADRGARRLVLAGRTPLPPRRDWDGADLDADARHKIAAIRALELRGVSVDAVALDIGSPAALQALLTERDAGGAPPIRGVIHAAGMTEAQLLTDISDGDRLRRTLWPKIAGAGAVAQAFPPASLDFLYLIASAGSVFGIPGQGAYAAGNAYLDCLARARHAQGDPAMSLDWVAWQGLGFGADAQIVTAELERLGSRPVVPDEAFAAWEQVSRYDIAQVVMAPLKSPEAEDGEQAGGSLISGAHRASGPSGAPTRDWSQLSAEELRSELQNGLRAILASELRMAEDQIEVDRPFAEMGLNSVTAMSIRREAEQLVGIELSATMLWNHPTIVSFADYLAVTLTPQGSDGDAGDASAENDADDSADSVLDSLFDSVESTS
ncbi:type I polyketide synthase [Mycolicibacterium palauense]|uniref:type I polyketide synthase n=1 Tax=Mycolicibacterium palauense TaxID=2034511 RepID=UPI000BFEF720|nr:type I polyketide synthase [Mycolicibacterium palauense]